MVHGCKKFLPAVALQQWARAGSCCITKFSFLFSHLCTTSYRNLRDCPARGSGASGWALCLLCDWQPGLRAVLDLGHRLRVLRLRLLLPGHHLGQISVCVAPHQGQNSPTGNCELYLVTFPCKNGQCVILDKFTEYSIENSADWQGNGCLREEQPHHSMECYSPGRFLHIRWDPKLQW